MTDKADEGINIGHRVESRPGGKQAIVDTDEAESQTDEQRAREIADMIDGLSDIVADNVAITIFEALRQSRAEGAEKKAEFLKAIGGLVEWEGYTVQINCQNPEEIDPEKAWSIDCFGEWTDWKHRRFYGESIEDCIFLAAAEKADCDAVEPYDRTSDGATNDAD